MSLLRKARWMFLALLLSLVPASSFAGVLISVGIAPPILPVYVQPACPEPGLMWTPGYWAYGPDGYYWVPGAWVPAPYEGALWTPPYWGWSGGLYVFHSGYWGRHVGYYGGINYGFGYMGVGFAGGLWRGHDFVYNTAVVRVDNVHVRNVYVDRTIVERNTIVNDRHYAFNGPNGIHHDARPEERMARNEQHIAATRVQMDHMQAARNDRTFYANKNGGHPQNAASERPMAFHGPQGNARPAQNSLNNNRGPNNNQNRPQFQQRQQNQPQPRGFEQQPRGNSQQPRGNQQQPRNESRPAPQEHGGGGSGHPQHDDHGHK
ncbi:MAG TPA: YXWGXW repeat-containing protein [Terracidiphilus sp.]|jgi:hypothetical protein